MSPKLISTIIAIIIGIIATIAGIRYGGEAFNEGRMKADVLKLTSEMDQVAAASQLYMIDHGRMPTTEELKDGTGEVRTIAAYFVEEYPGKYLSEIPLGVKRTTNPDASWLFDQTYINTAPINSKQFCAYINKEHGGSGLEEDILSCDEPRDQYRPCCVN